MDNVTYVEEMEDLLDLILDYQNTEQMVCVVSSFDTIWELTHLLLMLEFNFDVLEVDRSYDKEYLLTVDFSKKTDDDVVALLNKEFEQKKCFNLEHNQEVLNERK